MVIKTIKDHGFDQDMLDLVTEVFKINEVSYDPKWFVPVAVRPAIWRPSFRSHNSIMTLCPLTSNMRLPNLNLGYDRKDLEETITPFDPVIRDLDNGVTALQMLEKINKSMGNQVVLKEEDFYDTYIAGDEQGSFVFLIPKPSSYFYIGGYKVPIDLSDDMRLSFSITETEPFIPVKLKLSVETKTPFKPVKVKLTSRIF